jgi:hypothetical protein
MAFNVSTGIGTTRTSGVSNRELAIKVFSGEVMTSFETKNVFLPLVKTRTISSGKSASFAVIGKYDSAVATHVPGEDVVPNLINAGERVIEIDSLKHTSVFVDRFEEAMQHYETRATYAMEMGRKLAIEVDKAIISALDDAAAGSANADDTNGGEGQPGVQTGISCGILTTDSNAQAGDKILAALYDAQTAFDEDDIPGERYVVMSPKNYNRLVQSGAVNKDVTAGNNGGIDTGKINQVAGHMITVSNNIGADTIYMFTNEAVGVVKLLDIKTEAEYLIQKQGTLMVSSYAMGFGILNNGCVIKLDTTAA